MKLRHLLSASLLCGFGMAGARDVHGVKGYYNWTPLQMQASSVVQLGPEGYKWESWSPDFLFEDDYLNWRLGVNNTTRRDSSGFEFRFRLDFREAVKGTGFVTMTPDYPIYVFKVSLPMQTETKKGSSNTLWSEFFWHNPYTGAQDEDMCGNGAGGLFGFTNGGKKVIDIAKNAYPYLKDQYGRDSVAIVWANKETPYEKVVADGKEGQVAQVGDTVWFIKRLPVDYEKDKCEFVVAVNFASIRDSSSLALPSKRLLDRVSIKISHFSFGLTTYADTLYAELDEKGDTISTRAKTREEVPNVYVKWIRTAKNISEVWNSLTEEDNWGDGPYESPQKGVLNTTLYEAETVIEGFVQYMGEGDNAYTALKEEQAKANEVYEKEGATSEEYEQAAVGLKAAMSAFNAYLNPDENLVYNYIRTADNSLSLYVGKDDVTKDSYMGKPVMLGSNEGATPLTFLQVSESDGLRVYNLKCAEGTVVQCADGTLLVVPGSADAATFTFANRDGEGSFDMKCGSYYYYKDGYNLKCVSSVPTDNYDDMLPYCFLIEDALESYNPTEDEKSGLFEAWEFNGEAEEDPSTKGVVNGVEMTMGEHGQTFMLDGWRMQRWRMWSRVNKGTYKSADGEELGCLKLTVADTYDSFDGTSKGNATVYPTSPSMRREGGIFTNFYDRDPAGGVRDESCLVNLNPGVRRYLAIKCKGTNPDITIDVFNFLEKPGSVATAFALNLADAEAKGDVYYWDLMKYISVGKMPYVSQYFSTMGFQKDDALYIDWIRTFETEEDIPSESFATAISDVQADGDGLKVFVTGRTINVFTAEAGAIYTVDGMRVASFEGTVHQTVLPGMYIVRAGDTVKKVLVR